MGFLGDIFGAPLKALGGIGDFLGDVPIVGDILGAAGPLAGLIPGIGPILPAILGGLGGGAEGAMGALTSQQIMEAMRQSQADSQRARDLTDQAIGSRTQAWEANSPLRDAYRQGVFSIGEAPGGASANPFFTNLFAGMGVPQAGPTQSAENPLSQTIASLPGMISPTAISPIGTGLGDMKNHYDPYLDSPRHADKDRNREQVLR